MAQDESIEDDDPNLGHMRCNGAAQVGSSLLHAALGALVLEKF